MHRPARLQPSRLTGVALGAIALCFTLPRPADADGYQQTNLVTDNQAYLAAHGDTPAAVTDSSLINPWGISYGPTGPFWVSDNGNGLSTLYNGAGTKQGLVVTIPPPAGSAVGATSAPTGQVSGFGGAAFVFDTEDGTIASWSGSNGTTAVTRTDNSATTYAPGVTGAVYKGLAQGGGDLLAANFRSGNLDVFAGTFGTTFGSVGSFTDPNLQAQGYAPFGVQNVAGTLYVTFAKQDAAKHDEIDGAGLGYVDIFNPATDLFSPFAAGGTLNAPWGLALAPTSFGAYANALLVGNFGDGRVSAFNPASHAYLGQLTDPSGSPIAIDGLWALTPGNGGNGGSTAKIYFTAGINGEKDGLLGSLAPAAAAVPEPGSLALFLLGLPAVALLARRRATS